MFPAKNCGLLHFQRKNIWIESLYNLSSLEDSDNIFKCNYKLLFKNLPTIAQRKRLQIHRSMNLIYFEKLSC